MSPNKRKKHVIDVCLNTFVQKGLSHTSTRDLCEALNLNTGGIFWYFKTKDEIIIACAEEARHRIQNNLFCIAISDIETPYKLARDLHEKAIAMRPMMKFFISVCSLEKYNDALQNTLDTLGDGYKYYIDKIAERLCCKYEDVAPYVYIVINTMMSFMIFGRQDFQAPQLDLVMKELQMRLAKRDAQSVTAGASCEREAIHE